MEEVVGIKCLEVVEVFIAASPSSMKDLGGSSILNYMYLDKDFLGLLVLHQHSPPSLLVPMKQQI